MVSSTKFTSAIVVPGKKLLPDNSPAPVLISRLGEAASLFTSLVEAGGNPLIMVSGGNVALISKYDP